MAFSMIVAVFTEYFDHATGAFVDFVSCLVEFAFNRVAEEIAMGALHLLQSCAAQLTSAASIPSEAATLPSVETPLPDTIPEGVTEPAAGGDLSVPPAFVPVAGERHTIAPPAEGGVAAGASEGTISIDVRTTSGGSFGALTMDEFFLRWFPILSGLSRIVIDCETLSVRRKGRSVRVAVGLARLRSQTLIVGPRRSTPAAAPGGSAVQPSRSYSACCAAAAETTSWSTGAPSSAASCTRFLRTCASRILGSTKCRRLFGSRRCAWRSTCSPRFSARCRPSTSSRALWSCCSSSWARRTKIWPKPAPSASTS